MKKEEVCLLAMLLVSLVLLAIAGCQEITGFAAKEKQTALVTQVTDGDTITIEGGTRVRLLGINSPEKGEKYFSDAKEFVKQKILYQEVELERDITNKDQYGRLLRYVWLGSELVNEYVVRQGLAIAQFYEPNHKYSDVMAAAEKQAIGEKLGIWSSIAAEQG